MVLTEIHSTIEYYVNNYYCMRGMRYRQIFGGVIFWLGESWVRGNFG